MGSALHQAQRGSKAGRVLADTGVLPVALLLSFCVIVGKVGAFGQEMLTAAIFGASRSVDVFVTSRMAPSFIAGAIGSTLALVVIPWLEELKIKSQDSSRRQVPLAVVLGASSAFVMLAFLCLMFALPLLQGIAPGYSTRDQQRGALMMAAIIPSAYMDCLALVLIALLQSKERFRDAAIAPLAGVALSIVVLLATSGFLHEWGLVLAYSLGSFTQAALLLRVAWPSLKVGKTTLVELTGLFREASHRGLPVLAAIAVLNIFAFTDRILASSFGEGGVAVLNWAQKLMNLPIGIAVLPLLAAAFPQMAQVALDPPRDRGIGKVLLVSTFALIPAGVLLATAPELVVGAVFQRGAFDAFAAARTARVLAGYGVGLLFIGGFAVLVRIAYALGDRWSSVWASLVGAFVYLPAALILSKMVGLEGVAQAYSIGMACACMTLGVLIEMKHKAIGKVMWTGETLRILASGLVMTIFMKGSLYLFRGASGGLIATLIGGSALALYLVTCTVTGSETCRTLSEIAKSALAKLVPFNSRRVGETAGR